MGYVAPILQLVGTGVQAYGQYKTGKDASDVYKYNKAIAKYQAKAAKDRGELEVSQLQRDVAKAISRKRAIAGKSGTDTGSGSNLDVIDQMQREGDIDASIIRYNADLNAWSASQGANLLGTQADQMYNAGLFGAGTTLLNSASRYDWQNVFKQKRPSSTYDPTRFGVRPGV